MDFQSLPVVAFVSGCKYGVNSDGLAGFLYDFWGAASLDGTLFFRIV